MTTLSVYGNDRILVQEISASGFNPVIEATRTCYAAAIGNVDTCNDVQNLMTENIPHAVTVTVTAGAGPAGIVSNISHCRLWETTDV